MKKRLWHTALASVLVLALALAGCGKSEEATKPDSDANKKPVTLIYGRGGESAGLDPITVTDGESLRVTENIFETLVTYEDDSSNIVPLLAKEWQISDDGLTYTFKLQEGVKFHDGTDFNADAVVFNFNRWMDPSNPLHIQGKFEYYISQFGGVKGDETHVIDSVTALDTYTVQFKLKRPMAPFLANLGMSAFGIASPTALEKYKDKFTENPVGTGPFKFVEWKRNDTITLEKNPDYWRKGYPKVDKVVFKLIPDNSNRLTALINGEIDLMDGVNPDDIEKIKADANLQLFERPSFNVGYLGFNVEKKPFDNPKVRQAIAHAIDKQALIDAFFAGQGKPAVNPMPPTLWGHNNDITDREFNLEKAKQLLKEAGYPNGFKTKFWAMPVPRPYMPDGQKIAEAIQQNLKQIGIDAEIVSFDWPTYLDKTAKGEQDMFLLGWTGDNGDPDNFLYVLLDKNNIGGGNRTRYAGEQAHNLMLQAQSEVNQDKRAEIYKEVQQIIFNDAPMIPLVHSIPVLAGKKSVKGYVPSWKGSESLENVSIEE